MNLFKYTIVVFFWFFVSVSCNRVKTNKNIKPEKPNTTIKGQLLNSSVSYVVLISDNTSDTVQMNSQNQFEFNVFLSKPGFITLLNGTNSLRFFAEPKKNINLTFNVEDVINSIQIDGENINENLYLKKKLQLLLEHSMPISHLYNRNVKEFRHLVDSFYIVEKFVLEEHIEKHSNLSQTFIKLEKASLFYDRATKLIEYPRMSSYGKNISSKYLNFLNEVDVNDPSLLNLFEYKQFLNAYIEYFTYKKIFSDEIREVYPYEASLARMQMVSAKISNPAIKNYLLYEILSSQIKYHGYKNAELLFKTFEMQYTDMDKKDELLKNYNKYRELNNNKAAPNFKFEDINGIEYDLSVFKGKYIYIDVWATWCLPCRKEAPFFEKQKQAFINKNVEFVSLSIDKKKSDWKEYLTVRPMDGNCFWIPNFESFLEQYMIKTIPHFIIIDPNGNIVNADAPRPSDEKIEWLKKLPEKESI
ncbi:MAG: TlpA family protein disulfide reductase [Salinivirgaceae bacterium]|nr:TlpA family protein disulfide reductase [Salinivirgaceae bacterium]